jgi:hypothetical protein
MKRLSLGTSGSTNQLLIDVPNTGNYFVWLNQFYMVQNTGTPSYQATSVTLKVNLDTSVDSVVKTITGADSFERREYGLGSQITQVADSPFTLENLNDRIVYPAEQVRINSAFSDSVYNYFLIYTEVYFGGKASF